MMSPGRRNDLLLEGALSLSGQAEVGNWEDQAAAVGSLFDLEKVEVLLGPSCPLILQMRSW